MNDDATKKFDRQWKRDANESVEKNGDKFESFLMLNFIDWQWNVHWSQYFIHKCTDFYDILEIFHVTM